MAASRRRSNWQGRLAGRGGAGRSARPDELVLAVVALDQGRVDRGREGGVVELERNVRGARVLGHLAPRPPHPATCHRGRPYWTIGG
jgi:hypothetical protein